MTQGRRGRQRGFMCLASQVRLLGLLPIFLVALVAGCCKKPPPQPPRASVVVVERDCLTANGIAPIAGLVAPEEVACPEGGPAGRCYSHAGAQQLIRLLAAYFDFVSRAEAHCRAPVNSTEETSP